MCDITNVKTKPALFTSTIPNDERLIVDSSSVSLTGPRELAATMEMSELSRTWSLLSVLVEPVRHYCTKTDVSVQAKDGRFMSVKFEVPGR